MNRPNFINPKKGGTISARDYKNRGDILAAIAASLHIQSYGGAVGFHTRRTPTPITIRSVKIQAGGVPADDPPDATTFFTCKLLGSDGNEIGSDIEVFPRTHLGVNPYDGDVWPDLAATDVLQAGKDVDGKWYFNGVVFDDKGSCVAV